MQKSPCGDHSRVCLSTAQKCTKISLSFLLITATRHNSYTIKFILLEYTINYFLSKLTVTLPSPLTSKHFYHPKTTPHIYQQPLPVPPAPQPWQPPIPINVIIQYVALCDWLLALSIMLSRFIRVIPCVSTVLHIFLWLHDIPLYEYTIVYPIIN